MIYPGRGKACLQFGDGGVDMNGFAVQQYAGSRQSQCGDEIGMVDPDQPIVH